MTRDERHATPGLPALVFGTLGIVYGDIGTSPIYAFREAFDHSELTVDQSNGFGVASVVFWSLVIIISIKYLALVMRADNQGEGGILALTALVMPRSGVAAKGIMAGVITLGVFGTSLLYGDGLITPAISVLSAVEGFEVATSAFEAWVLPITIAILVALFSVQKRGTAKIARVFSPIMIVWFTVIGALGLRQVAPPPLRAPGDLTDYGIDLFVDHPWRAFLALGSIFLVVTGGEALYADMGHFGRRPIQISWYVIVLPALLLNYFGQAALLADDARGDREPVLQPGTGLGHHAARDPGDDGDRDRLAGVDHRCLLAHDPGGAARLPAAPQDPPHVGAAHRSGVRATRELAADDRMRRAGASVSARRAPSRRRTASPSPRRC